MPCQFLIDFDGTIALVDTTDLLLETFAGPEWEMIEQAWARGEISSRECLAGQVALLSASEADFRRVLASVAVDPHFHAFLLAAERIGATAQIVSDGFDRNIETILGHGQTVPRMSNRLQPAGKGRWNIAFPHARPDCASGSGVCKCAAMEAGRRTVLIGDGRSDFCLAGKVDFVLAKGKLADHCAQMDYPHRRIASFADAIEWLEQDAPRHFPTLAFTSRPNPPALGHNDA